MKLEFQLNWIDITEYVSVCVGLTQSHVAITFKFFNLVLKRKDGLEIEKTVIMRLMVQVQWRMFDYMKCLWAILFQNITIELRYVLLLFIILYFRMRFRTDGSVTDNGFRLHIWPCWFDKKISFPKFLYVLTLYVLINILIKTFWVVWIKQLFQIYLEVNRIVLNRNKLSCFL